ncbi:MAG: hypothetical protein FLDDKLPJ_01680 [Phycisphaerae bacterium]|nr:hypothetical protein [Phycisphaerae bacterium]
MRVPGSAAAAAAIIGIAASPTTAGADGERSVARWTVLVYMSGDNDLESFIVKDLERELAATGSTDEIHVVALADRAPGYDDSRGDWTTTKLFYVDQGMRADPGSALADWGERNMGDAQTLIDFVAWGREHCPAERYALYFWGHGWNWHPGYVMSDDTDRDSLDLDELAAALPEIGFIDFVGYDGCNMAAIEVQTLWHGHATALAHSQEWVGWHGVEYDVVLAQLAARPEMTADELAVATSQSATSDRTWSAVAVDHRFEALLTAVDAWSVALLDGLDRNRGAYKAAFRRTQSFWQAPMDKDLYDMAHQIQRHVNDAALQDASQAVLDAVDAVVLHERHRAKYDDAHGITIHHPSNRRQQTNRRYYEGLEFSRQTRWNEFLKAYLR